MILEEAAEVAGLSVEVLRSGVKWELGQLIREVSLVSPEF